MGLRNCQYCGKQLSDRSDLRECPSCRLPDPFDNQWFEWATRSLKGFVAAGCPSKPRGALQMSFKCADCGHQFIADSPTAQCSQCCGPVRGSIGCSVAGCRRPAEYRGLVDWKSGPVCPEHSHSDCHRCGFPSFVFEGRASSTGSTYSSRGNVTSYTRHNPTVCWVFERSVDAAAFIVRAWTIGGDDTEAARSRSSNPARIDGMPAFTGWEYLNAKSREYHIMKGHCLGVRVVGRDDAGVVLVGVCGGKAKRGLFSRSNLCRRCHVEGTPEWVR